MTDLTLPDMGSTINSVYTTLTSQVENMISLYERKGDKDSVDRLTSLNTVINSNFELLIDVGNESTDVFNQMVSIAETNAVYKSKYENEHKLRQIEADKIIGIVEKYEKTVAYNEELIKANKLLQQQNGELQSTKRQIVSVKEANQNKDAEIVKLKQRLQTTESKMHTSLTLVSACIQHMRYIRETMIFEGLAVSETFIVDNQLFYGYRRPGTPTDWTNVVDTPLSPEHDWYWRIETNSGYHYDVLPKLNGGIVVGKPKAIPANIKKVLEAEFEKNPKFGQDDLNLREDKLNQQLKTLELRLLDCQVFLAHEQKQLKPMSQTKKKKSR